MGAKLDTTKPPQPLTKVQLDDEMSPFDLKRLESYADNMLDYHAVLDLIPQLAMLYFTGRLKSDIRLSGVQQSILLAIGLQRKDLDTLPKEISAEANQILSMFTKIMRKMSSHLSSLVSGAISEQLPKQDTIGVSRADANNAFDDEVVDARFAPLETTLQDELEEGGDEALKALREKQRELIDALPLDQ
jgi:N-acetyltransferase 10